MAVVVVIVVVLVFAVGAWSAFGFHGPRLTRSGQLAEEADEAATKPEPE
jgi:hypothetical protein